MGSCYSPSITFEFERFDHDEPNKFIDIVDENRWRIRKCGGYGNGSACGVIDICLNEYSFNIDAIEVNGDWFKITAVNSNGIMALCGDYTINASVTIHCEPNPTIDPTIDPTLMPTSEPTVDPTSDPILNPTSFPTSNPTTKGIGSGEKEGNGIGLSQDITFAIIVGAVAVFIIITLLIVGYCFIFKEGSKHEGIALEINELENTTQTAEN